MNLREKAKWLFKAGHNTLYFRLLLKQKKISKEDKRYIEKLWKIAGVENG